MAWISRVNHAPKNLSRLKMSCWAAIAESWRRVDAIG